MNEMNPWKLLAIYGGYIVAAITFALTYASWKLPKATEHVHSWGEVTQIIVNDYSEYTLRRCTSCGLPRLTSVPKASPAPDRLAAMEKELVTIKEQQERDVKMVFHAINSSAEGQRAFTMELTSSNISGLRTSLSSMWSNVMSLQKQQDYDWRLIQEREARGLSRTADYAQLLFRTNRAWWHEELDLLEKRVRLPERTNAPVAPSPVPDWLQDLAARDGMTVEFQQTFLKTNGVWVLMPPKEAKFRTTNGTSGILIDPAQPKNPLVPDAVHPIGIVPR